MTAGLSMIKAVLKAQALAQNSNHLESHWPGSDPGSLKADGHSPLHTQTQELVPATLIYTRGWSPV